MASGPHHSAATFEELGVCYQRERGVLVKSFRAKSEPQLVGCYIVVARRKGLDVAFLALGGVGHIGHARLTQLSEEAGVTGPIGIPIELGNAIYGGRCFLQRGKDASRDDVARGDCHRK